MNGEKSQEDEAMSFAEEASVEPMPALKSHLLAVPRPSAQSLEEEFAEEFPCSEAHFHTNALDAGGGDKYETSANDEFAEECHCSDRAEDTDGAVRANETDAKDETGHSQKFAEEIPPSFADVAGGPPTTKMSLEGVPDQDKDFAEECPSSAEPTWVYDPVKVDPYRGISSECDEFAAEFPMILPTPLCADYDLEHQKVDDDVTSDASIGQTIDLSSSEPGRHASSDSNIRPGAVQMDGDDNITTRTPTTIATSGVTEFLVTATLATNDTDERPFVTATLANMDEKRKGRGRRLLAVLVFGIVVGAVAATLGGIQNGRGSSQNETPAQTQSPTQSPTRLPTRAPTVCQWPDNLDGCLATTSEGDPEIGELSAISTLIGLATQLTALDFSSYGLVGNIPTETGLFDEANLLVSGMESAFWTNTDRAGALDKSHSS